MTQDDRNTAAPKAKRKQQITTKFDGYRNTTTKQKEFDGIGWPQLPALSANQWDGVGAIVCGAVVVDPVDERIQVCVGAISFHRAVGSAVAMSPARVVKRYFASSSCSCSRTPIARSTDSDTTQVAAAPLGVASPLKARPVIVRRYTFPCGSLCRRRQPRCRCLTTGGTYVFLTCAIPPLGLRV